MASKKWTSEQDAVVKELYGKVQAKEIAEKIGRTAEAVRIRAKTLGINRDRPERWTKKEEALLIEKYEELGPTEMHILIPNKSIAAIQGKARLMSLKCKEQRMWSSEEEQFMRDNYQQLSNKEIEAFLDRSENSVQRKAEEMGLSRERGPSLSEVVVESWLKDLGIPYTTQKKERYFLIDFAVELNNKLIAIEVHGDYWHCNPVVFPKGPKDSTQEFNVQRDIRKKEYLESLGYTLYYIWESDIKSNLIEQKELLAKFILST
jgi:G:T-mismatch repair DNA endonuclease (very short patch repair protein)